ncbi:MAG: carbon starvation protein A [Firmicutes bacterium]|nr:carbon starvation protein A [Bacillota bacterium]
MSVRPQGARIRAHILMGLIALLVAVSFGVMAVHRGETINSLWLLAAALGSYALAYRFYALWIGRRIMGLDPRRATPALTHTDSTDYVPQNRWVLYGHHFAAIAGAGPLVGPVLAAQMGWLPGTLWIILGAVFAGCVQDFVILFASTRRGGRSLGEIAREEIGPVGGWFAMIGIYLISIILIAVLALVVVNALAQSPWGTFVIAMTIPIAILMGFYMRLFRPGRIGEATILGVILLIVALIFGRAVANSPLLAPIFTLTPQQLAIAMMIYGFVASVLPVWFLLVPRDYLSTVLKIGTMVLLAIGIVIVHPQLQMDGLTRFVDGTGPVAAGSIFPFLFITIACGAVSGWHAVVSSGTSPKMIRRENDIPWIGYGGMMTESFVAVMAMIAACLLTPGVYFAINAPPAAIGTTVQQAAQTISSWGFTVDVATLQQTANNIGEQSILSRTGGAPSLAVGMANLFKSFLGGDAVMAFWYHFAILFEAVFILTTVDAGTRVGRFLLQDIVGRGWKKFGQVTWYPGNVIASAVFVALWGYFLYAGVIDPNGGIHTLWPLFGIVNQMLAAMALCIGTTVFIKMGRRWLSLVTFVPMLFMYADTWTAALTKIFSSKIGFFAASTQLQQQLATGTLPATAANLETVFNNRVDGVLCAVFLVVMLVLLIDAVRIWLRAWRSSVPIVHEEPYRSVEEVESEVAAGRVS